MQIEYLVLRLEESEVETKAEVLAEDKGKELDEIASKLGKLLGRELWKMKGRVRQF